MTDAQRIVCFVSDRTGITTETLGHSILSRFGSLRFRMMTMPFVLSVAQAEGVVARIESLAAEHGGKPIVLRAVNPVPTPKSTRPGASLSSVAKPLAAAGAMRLVGTRTPVPSRIRLVRTAASAIDTNTSATSICVS